MNSSMPPNEQIPFTWNKIWDAVDDAVRARVGNMQPVPPPPWRFRSPGDAAFDAYHGILPPPCSPPRFRYDMPIHGGPGRASAFFSGPGYLPFPNHEDSPVAHAPGDDHSPFPKVPTEEPSSVLHVPWDASPAPPSSFPNRPTVRPSGTTTATAPGTPAEEMPECPGFQHDGPSHDRNSPRSKGPLSKSPHHNKDDNQKGKAPAASSTNPLGYHHPPSFPFHGRLRLADGYVHSRRTWRGRPGATRPWTPWFPEYSSPWNECIFRDSSMKDKLESLETPRMMSSNPGPDPWSHPSSNWDDFDKTETPGPIGGDDRDHFSPDMDVVDLPSKTLIFVSLPGAKKEDVDVTYSPLHDSVTIRGVVGRPVGLEEQSLRSSMVRSERKFGGFARTVALTGPHAAWDKYTAKLEDGVLRLDVPKYRACDDWEDVKRVPVE